MNWEKKKDENYHHTASTVYIADGFKVWKGKYRVFSVIYSANEWHLERISDHAIIASAKTAKKCRAILEYNVEKGVDINSADEYSFYRSIF